MSVTNVRRQVLLTLLTELENVCPDGRALIALDGVDGVGKSYLSCELVELAGAHSSRPVVPVSIDGFHRPRAERVSAGTGPEGFYRGSYRYGEFRSCIVDAVRRGTPITPAVWDVASDRAVDAASVEVPARAIVLVDGVFLQRPELADAWDATVWVDAPFEVTVPRGTARFPGRHDPEPDAESNQRYVGGQRLYLADAKPRERSTWILDNEDLQHPVLTRGVTVHK